VASEIVPVRSSLHEEAIKYASKGIPVFPIVRNRDIVAVKWSEVATTDPIQINEWWSKTTDSNIGILTGPKSGVAVAHFLTQESWNLAQEKGLPVTPIAAVNKGHHVYFKYKGVVDNVLVGDMHSGVILIGDRRYVIAPPSVLSENPGAAFDRPNVFSWLDGKGLEDVDLADVPEWMMAGSISGDSDIVEPVVDVAEEKEKVINERQGIKELREKRVAEDVSEVADTKIDSPPFEPGPLTAIDTAGEVQGETGSLPFEDWKAPVLFDGPGVEHIKAEMLPSWLGGYAGAISQSKQTPEGLAVMLGLSIVAASVQKKFVVAPYGDDDYTEQLSLWTVTVLKSGERKSAILNPMRNPLVVWEKEQAELLETQIQDTATAINIAQKRIDKLQKEAGNEPDPVKRQGLVSQISEIRASMPVQVKAPVLWTADVTPEALQDMLAEHDEKMALLSDEGNIFEIMAGLYNEGKINIDIFLQAYSGSPTKIMRKTRKVDLDKPALTFGLAVQPVVIETFGKGNKTEFKGKGALGRFLFCLPESMLGKRIAGDRTIVPADVKARYEAGIRQLLSVPKLLNDAGKEVPRMLVLDQDALGVWVQFDARVEGMLGPGGELESMDDWGGKLPGTALRIAGIMHLVEHGPENLTIGADTLNRSIALCDILIGHAKAAYGLIGADEEVSDAKKIFLWMQRNGFEVFTKTACSRAFKSMSDIDDALKALEERNILRELMVPTKGRDAANYISNPMLKFTGESEP